MGGKAITAFEVITSFSIIGLAVVALVSWLRHRALDRRELRHYRHALGKAVAVEMEYRRMQLAREARMMRSKYDAE